MKKLNDLDLKILRHLTNNARVPLRDVAEGENSSRSSVNQRLQRMIESGVITSLKYHVNPKKLGYNTCTFVGVRLERGSLYKEVAARLEEIPEITECHYTTGPYTLLITLHIMFTGLCIGGTKDLINTPAKKHCVERAKSILEARTQRRLGADVESA